MDIWQCCGAEAAPFPSKTMAHQNAMRTSAVNKEILSIYNESSVNLKMYCLRDLFTRARVF